MLYKFLISGDIARMKRLRLGRAVCIPSVCSTDKIHAFVNERLERADLRITTGYRQELFCSTDEPPKLEVVDIFFM